MAPVLICWLPLWWPARLQMLMSIYVIWANRSFKRPLALTRCRTCADRREDQGSLLDLAYEPTVINSPHDGCNHSSVSYACVVVDDMLDLLWGDADMLSLYVHFLVLSVARACHGTL